MWDAYLNGRSPREEKERTKVKIINEKI